MMTLDEALARVFPVSKMGRVPDRRMRDETKTTGCVVWLGPMNSAKGGKAKTARPKTTRPPKRTTLLVHREWFAAYHGIKLAPHQHVANVCGNPACVNPRHHVLRSGKDARRARGYSLRGLDHAKRLIMARVKGATGPGMGFWWHGHPRLWECDPHAVEIVSQHCAVPRMGVLLAYALLFHEANPERGAYEQNPGS